MGQVLPRTPTLQHLRPGLRATRSAQVPGHSPVSPTDCPPHILSRLVSPTFALSPRRGEHANCLSWVTGCRPQTRQANNK
jgi:hypothetical protein